MRISFVDWLLADLNLPKGIHSSPESVHPWWRVMCLTGVDYFSTLGYQPGIAFLAAGALSPLATLTLVLVTLFAALPVYRRVAEESPNGQGSISMLERLFPKWAGKVFVLALLGFATTDFIVTMTLSAADGAAHFIQNPLTPDWMRNQMAVTMIILLILGGVFLKGFREAIRLAVILVAAYLGLTMVVTLVGLWHVLLHPHLFAGWIHILNVQHSNPLAMVGISLLLFPKLALGLSGFETGVAVMPLIDGHDRAERTRNTKKLLATAATIMSVFLIATSFVTTLLIEPRLFREGGQANGRALAYLAHKYLGEGFGTVYDLSAILILGFAGASAMAGLLNLIPRYLPRFGMAPEWAKASRPLVLVFLAIDFAVTILFRADVDAQGGAYATGVLVLITSASVAVTVTVWKNKLRWPFLLIALVFAYTTIVNIYERPEGLKISMIFIFSIVLTSLVSRAMRSTELRITEVVLDETVNELLSESNGQVIRLIARKPRIETPESLDQVDRIVRRAHSLSEDENLYFFEVERGDASEFTERLCVSGERIGAHVVLHARCATVANSIAAMLIHLERTTGSVPHAYFKWNEGNPVGNLFRFIFLGEGDTAPLVHEVLRRAMPDPTHRPIVHVS
ncbi:MAG: amino acid permease [Bryobacteraceae bacterium]